MVTVEAEIKNVVISLRAQLTVLLAELPRWGLGGVDGRQCVRPGAGTEPTL